MEGVDLELNPPFHSIQRRDGFELLFIIGRLRRYRSPPIVKEVDIPSRSVTLHEIMISLCEGAPAVPFRTALTVRRWTVTRIPRDRVVDLFQTRLLEGE